MSSRIYIGRLPHRAVERDIERFFKGYGRIREVLLKNGYGFVEFDDNRDADDAVYELNGKELCGERITVEHARAPPGMRGGRRRSRSPFRRGGRGDRDRDSSRKEFGPPVRTEYRIVIENLSSRVSWQDLKDLMRKTGEVCYADAHKSRRNEGIVEFTSYSDMKCALDKYDGIDLYGRRLRLIEDKPRKRSRSRSRSRSPSRSRSRSRSRDRSRSRSRRSRHSRSPRSRRSRSRSGKRSRSRSYRKRSRSRSDRKRSHSRSLKRSPSRSPSRSPNKDRSRSPIRKSKSKSPSPDLNRSKSPVERNHEKDTEGSEDDTKMNDTVNDCSRDKSKSRSCSPQRKRLATGSRSRSASRSRSPSAQADNSPAQNGNRRDDDPESD